MPPPKPTASGRAAEAPPDKAPPSSGADAGVKVRVLEEIKASKAVFYNMVVAQAQQIDLAADRLTFTFSPSQRTLGDSVEQNRPWLEGLAQRSAGRKLAIVVVQGQAAPNGDAPGGQATGQGARNGGAVTANGGDRGRQSALREQALADTSVQALLEVFPAEIRDVEEM
jgi:hypothetical protein